MSKKRVLHLYSTEIVFCGVPLILSATSIENLRKSYILMTPTTKFQESNCQKTALSLIK